MARAPRLGGEAAVQMFYVYILKSLKTGSFYIGETEDPKNRLAKHNSFGVKSTRLRVPWSMIYLEKYQTKGEALFREKQIKSYKGGIAFKKLISGSSSDG